MPESDPRSLEERVARLERLVERLLEDGGTAPSSRAEPPGERREPGSHRWSWQREGGPTTGAGHAGSASGAEQRGAGTGATASGGRSQRTGPGFADVSGLADQGERWLGRVGVAFVVLAFGFLFKYAFDQGWIGPPMRLALGFATATAMLAIGLRLEGTRERYSQYLLGGAIGLYYLVGFASYELYALLPFAIAFAFMCSVTVLAFVLAERQKLPSLAVIGATGGLSTPFLVSSGSGNVPQLVAYTTLLLAGAGSIQFLRGWRTLLLVLGFGGLSVMALAVGMTAGPAVLEAGFTAVGILTAAALFGVFPLFRAQLQRVAPETWPDPPLPEWMGVAVRPGRIAMLLLRVGCVFGAFVAVLELGALFSVERETFGLLFGVAFLVYMGLSRLLAQTRIALHPSAETASILLVLAVIVYFLDYRIMLPLGVAAAAMHTSDETWGLPGVAALGHLVFAMLLAFVVGRTDMLGVVGQSPFGIQELGALGAIVLGLTTSFVLKSESAQRVYRIGAHVAFMAWLATQFAPMQRGQELISLSWGIYGIVLLLLSMRMRERGVQLAGLATLGIVAAKLLLVDMAQVDVIWRILLFMGFGAAFLGLSYLINRQDEPD